MKWATERGYEHVVKQLLRDQLVPTNYNPLNHLLSCAIKDNYPFLNSLLTDERIDPSFNNQLPIFLASFYGHTEAVRLLLADKRVDPSDRLSIRFASDKGHAGVVKLLLADQRVDISPLPLPSSPQVLVLFLLRRSYRLALKPTDFEQQPGLPSFVADIEKIESQRKSLLDAHLISDLSSLCLEYVPDLVCHLDAPISSLIDSSKGDIFPRFSFGCLSSL
jgi:hypothetical protein